MLSFDDRSGNGDADSNGHEDEDEDGVHDDDDVYVSTTMGAREVLASWLGWFTVSQSNTISWKKNDWDDDEKDEEEDQTKSDDTLIHPRETKEDVTC